jgi:predicted dehydrogenase
MAGPSKPAIRVGIIGTGFSAVLHAEAYRRVYGVDAQLVGVAGLNKAHSEEFAHKHEIPTAYSGYHELLADDSIDVVTLCVPNATHTQIAVDSANAGKHIVCEKPLTGSFSEGDAATRLREALDSADQMLAAAEANNVKLMYAENWVYAPPVTKVKRLLDASGGSILDIRAEESHSGSHAEASKRRATAGGGALMILGSHPIGGALHLKQYEGLRDGTPIRVKSVVADVSPMYQAEGFQPHGARWMVSDWVDVETWATAVLTFTDGSKAVINASFNMLGGVRNTMEVYTSNSAIKVNMTPNDAVLAYAPDPAIFADEYLIEKTETKAGWSFASPDEDWMRGYPQEIQDFSESVAFDRPPLSDGRLGRDVIEVVYSAYVSAETGKRVDLA